MRDTKDASYKAIDNLLIEQNAYDLAMSVIWRDYDKLKGRSLEDNIGYIVKETVRQALRLSLDTKED